jgi:micrococcal nuclease
MRVCRYSLIALLTLVLLSACTITSDLPLPALPAAPTTAPSALPVVPPATNQLPPATNQLPLPADLPRATVLEVVDGDTVVVDLDGRGRETVRLIGVDTPETVHPSRPVECYGKEASAKARTLLTGATVFLEDDPTQDSRDRFGRLLRFVWLSTGQLVNLELIAQGYAYEYTYEQPYKYQAEFQDAQRKAQATQSGLWSPTTCNGINAPAVSAPTAQPSGAASNANNCASEPNLERAPNVPIKIVAIDKRAETVELQNVSDQAIDLTGWRMCSLRGSQLHPLDGVLAPGKTRVFPSGGSIWSNNDRDDGVLYNASSELISYWPNQ